MLCSLSFTKTKNSFTEMRCYVKVPLEKKKELLVL
jgi:hypothetical protein